MHTKIVEEIRAAAGRLLQSSGELEQAIWHNEYFIATDPLPGVDYSPAELVSAAQTLAAFASNIEIKESGPFIPTSFVGPILSHLNEVNNACSDIPKMFANKASIKAWNKGAYIFVYRNDTQGQLAKSFAVLLARLDSGFSAWYQLRTVLRTPKLSEFGRIVSQLQEQRASIVELNGEIEDMRLSIEGNVQKSQRALEKADAADAEIQRLLKDSDSNRKTISEYTAEATNKSAEIKAIEEKAAALSSTINEYQADFDAFDEELEKRNQRFEQEAIQLDEIHQSLDAQRDEIKRLIEQSEGLLRGATNVGLAASFSKLQSKIDGELTWARRSFYFSIAVLVILSIPIALYVFPGLQPLLHQLVGVNVASLIVKPLENHTTQEVVAQIAARALLLVPGIWLVRFTSARHERLFRLREQYAYKYSIASSIEGFKKQAPDLEEGIAATAFYELTFNPATRMDSGSTETRYPNPAMDWLLKKLGGHPEGEKS